MGAKPRIRSNPADPLDRVRITASAREAAKAAMKRGERIANFIVGAIAAADSIIRGIERGLRALARTKPVN